MMVEYYVAALGLSTSDVVRRPSTTKRRCLYERFVPGKNLTAGGVRVGPDSRESRSYWGNQPFILCNTDGESEWECSSRNGTFLEADLIEEALI